MHLTNLPDIARARCDNRRATLVRRERPADGHKDKAGQCTDDAQCGGSSCEDPPEVRAEFCLHGMGAAQGEEGRGDECEVGQVLG